MTLVLPVRMELMELMELMAAMVSMVRTELTVSMVLKAFRAKPVLQVPLVLMAVMV